MKLTGENRNTRGKTCPIATLPTTNPTWTDPGLNPDLRGEMPVTNRLSHGTAYRHLGYWRSRYHLNRRIVVPQRRSGFFEEE